MVKLANFQQRTEMINQKEKFSMEMVDFANKQKLD
jgi:hypothetical protein